MSSPIGAGRIVPNDFFSPSGRLELSSAGAGGAVSLFFLAAGEPDDVVAAILIDGTATLNGYTYSCKDSPWREAESDLDRVVSQDRSDFCNGDTNFLV